MAAENTVGHSADVLLLHCFWERGYGVQLESSHSQVIGRCQHVLLLHLSQCDVPLCPYATLPMSVINRSVAQSAHSSHPKTHTHTRIHTYTHNTAGEHILHINDSAFIFSCCYSVWRKHSRGRTFLIFNNSYFALNGWITAWISSHFVDSDSGFGFGLWSCSILGSL